jgi:dUTP pyrophosphatase
VGGASGHSDQAAVGGTTGGNRYASVVADREGQ